MCYDREGVIIQGNKEDTIAGYKNITALGREQREIFEELANKNLETEFEYDSDNQILKLVVKGGQFIDKTVGGLVRTAAKSYIAGEIYLKGAKPTYEALKQLINTSGLVPGSGWAISKL